MSKDSYKRRSTAVLTFLSLFAAALAQTPDGQLLGDPHLTSNATVYVSGTDLTGTIVDFVSKADVHGQFSIARLLNPRQPTTPRIVFLETQSGLIAVGRRVANSIDYRIETSPPLAVKVFDAQGKPVLKAKLELVLAALASITCRRRSSRVVLAKPTVPAYASSLNVSAICIGTPVEGNQSNSLPKSHLVSLYMFLQKTSQVRQTIGHGYQNTLPRGESG